MELASELLKDFHSKLIKSQILKTSLPNKSDLQTFKGSSGFGQENCNWSVFQAIVYLHFVVDYAFSTMATTNFHVHAFYSKYYHGREIMFSPEFCMQVCLSVLTIPQKISKIDCILGEFEWKLGRKEAKFVLIFRQRKRNGKLAYCISYAQYMNRQSHKSCDFTAPSREQGGCCVRLCKLCQHCAMLNANSCGE